MIKVTKKEKLDCMVKEIYNEMKILRSKLDKMNVCDSCIKDSTGTIVILLNMYRIISGLDDDWKSK